jgi:hypothetical protein
MSGPVVVLFLVGVALAVGTWVRRGRPGPLVWVGAVALGWLFVDAMLAQGRLATGAPRYLLPGVGLACVVAGCVVAAAVRALQHRLGHTGWSRVALAAVAVGLVVVCVPRIVLIGGQVGAGIREGYREQALQTELPSAVATAGGRHTILGCGEVSTGPFQVPMLAWQLDVPVGRVAVAHAGTTGTVIELQRPTVSKGWTVLDSCPASHRQ